jgi:menaquinone-specific isochorismate synthase
MTNQGLIDSTLQQRYGRLLSYSMPCTGISFAGFLQNADGQERYYWENQNDHIAFAGAGTAVELTAWGTDRYQKISAQIKDLFAEASILGSDNPLTAPRLFGGFSFRDDFTPDNTWSIYSPAYFVLPHYQLVSIHGEMWLTINTQIPLDEDPVDLVDDLKLALEKKISQLKAGEWNVINLRQSPLASVNYPMTYDMWDNMITTATQRIRDGELNKVVLSRVAELQFDGRVNILPILRHLADHYAQCYRFLFEPRPHYAFYGASPELLAGVQGQRIETMGLAGSIGRGDSAESDAALSHELLHSKKDRHEHQIVVDKIRDRLAPLTTSLNIPEMGLLKLSNIQHIYTPISGVLEQENGVLAVVEQLHPTPALGGDPRDTAMVMISELEPIPRGWYGAPVGWVDSNLDGQFSVAIRSAVAQESRVWVYSGAGIVGDSVPQKEWDETALKFRPMLNAHGVS